MKLDMKIQMIPRLIILFFCDSAFAGDISIARGKPTAQGSTFEDFESSQAVDGIYGGNLPLNGGAHTDSLNPWWTVDLGDVYQISNVVIYNRDVRQYRLDNVYVEGFVSADPYFCDTHRNLCGFNPGPSGDVVKLNCPNNTLARYVRIRGAPFMTVVEVEVFGYTENDCQDLNQAWTQRSGLRLTKTLIDLGAALKASDCLVFCLRRGLCTVFNYNVLNGSCVSPTHPVTDEDLVTDGDWNVYHTC